MRSSWNSMGPSVLYKSCPYKKQKCGRWQAQRERYGTTEGRKRGDVSPSQRTPEARRQNGEQSPLTALSRTNPADTLIWHFSPPEPRQYISVVQAKLYGNQITQNKTKLKYISYWQEDSANVWEAAAAQHLLQGAGGPWWLPALLPCGARMPLATRRRRPPRTLLPHRRAHPYLLRPLSDSNLWAPSQFYQLVKQLGRSFLEEKRAHCMRREMVAVWGNRQTDAVVSRGIERQTLLLAGAPRHSQRRGRWTTPAASQSSCYTHFQARGPERRL